MPAAHRLAGEGPALAGGSMLRHRRVPAPAFPVPGMLSWRGSCFPGEAGGLSCFGQVYTEICFLNQTSIGPEISFYSMVHIASKSVYSVI